MSITQFSIGALALNALSAAAMAGTLGWEYMQPKLSSGEVQIHHACVMPAEAKLSKLGMKGSEGMSKESEAWSLTLQTIVESHLKQAGVEVQASGMSQQELEKDEDLQQTVLKLQSKYDQVSTQLDKHPKDTRKARFTVGDEVSLLPCSSHADTLIYVHGQGQVLTGGKKAFGLLVAGPKNSTGFLTLSLVDAKSGEILAYIRLLNGDQFVDDSEKAYGKRLDQLFQRMRIGTAAQAAKKAKRS